MIDVVCAVIQDENSRVLACLRPAGKHLAGLWEFPGGKIELSESPEVALKREILEELGVVIETVSVLRQVVWSYEDRAIRLLPFRCCIVSGKLIAREHDKLLWCAPTDCEPLTWADADVSILHEVFPELRA